MLISHTEPDSLKSAGRPSIIPEQYGADILFLSPHLGLVGVQRKEIDDLIASIQVGGRLQRELAKMNQLDVKILLIEGEPRWTTDGMLNSRNKWSISQHYGVIWSAQLLGCWVSITSSLPQSITYCTLLERWLKRKHDSLERRPKVRPAWGTRDNKDWAVGLLSQIDGVGLDRAGKIYDKYGLPLKWDEDRAPIEGLLEIEGIGPGTVEKIIRCLR